MTKSGTKTPSKERQARMRRRMGPQGLFTDDEVREILKDLEIIPATEVALKWDASYNTIRNIRSRMTYRHVNPRGPKKTENS